MNAAYAEFFLSMHGERVRAGLQARKRRGKPIGRRPVSMSVQGKARELRRAGRSYGDIAALLHVSKGTAHKYCKKVAG